MDTPLISSTIPIEDRRRNATNALDRDRRAAMGQFFTPQPLARYMASLFDFDGSDVDLLDPGAGIGSLTAAFADAVGSRCFRASCYEIDAHFHRDLTETLQSLSGVSAQVLPLDFIEAAVRATVGGIHKHHTHVIANPPYRKIGTSSRARRLVSKLGLETTNLYAAFIACAVARCIHGAQIVAIIPRSFTNGPYFKAFRYWLLDRVSLVRIHLFDRRDTAFSDDRVLQENVILKMIVGGEQGDVVVSTSTDDRFADLRDVCMPFEQIVTPGDEERFIHVPTVRADSASRLKGRPLRELDIDVCTGPVVDFRLRGHLRAQPANDTAPMLYAAHFNGGLQWPREGRKANAIAVSEESRRWLMPNGCYVVTRRFTSKEERRRIVAHVVPGNSLPGKWIGFENHLNVFHRNRQGLPEHLARGLCSYLNSKDVDDYFRTFSGHTQVNATDLRRLKYPSTAELEAMAND